MSGAATVFNAQIKGVDAATEPVKKVTSAVARLIESTRGLALATKGLTAANVEGAKAHTRFIAALSAHVRGLHGHIGTVNSGIASIRGSVAGLLPMIGALGAGASLAGLFQLTHSVAQASVESEALMKKLGTTGKQFGGLAYAAKVSGVPVEAVSGSMEKLNKTLGDAARGKNKTALSMFNKFGIDMKGVRSGAISAGDIMPRLAEAFEKTKGAANQSFLALRLFGRAGQEMIPILTLGKDALARLAAEGAKLSFFASPEQKKGLKEFEIQWIGLETAVGSFKKQLGASLAPVLGPLVQMAKEWVTANRPWIAQGIADKVKYLAEKLRELDIKRIVNETTEWFHWTVDMVNSLGGMKTVLGALALTMGSPLIGAVSGAIAIFASLGKALLALNAIAWANPILLAVLAVALSAYILVFHWEWAKTKMQAIFSWFSKENQWATSFLILLSPLYAFPASLMAAWETLKPGFTTLFTSLKSIINDFWSYIGPIIEKITNAWANLPNIRLPSINFNPGPMPDIGPGPRIRRAPDMPQIPTISPGGGVVPRSFGLLETSPSLYREGGPVRAASIAPAQTGSVDVSIAMTGVPPGTQIATRARGIARIDETDVGYMSPMPMPA